MKEERTQAHLDLLIPLQQFPELEKQEISIDTTLVDLEIPRKKRETSVLASILDLTTRSTSTSTHLIDDDMTDSLQVSIPTSTQPPQQHSRRAEQQPRIPSSPPLSSNGVSDET